MLGTGYLGADQRFSPRGDFAPRGHWAPSGGICVVTTGGCCGSQRTDTRGTAPYPTPHRTVPKAENGPAGVPTEPGGRRPGPDWADAFPPKFKTVTADWSRPVSTDSVRWSFSLHLIKAPSRTGTSRAPSPHQSCLHRACLPGAVCLGICMLRRGGAGSRGGFMRGCRAGKDGEAQGESQAGGEAFPLSEQ